MKRKLKLVFVSCFCTLSTFAQFITTWETTAPDELITIPTHFGQSYNCTVDWGDGTTTSHTGPIINHTYATPGTHTISISGVFPRIYFNNQGDKDKILTIEQWGTQVWSSMENAFYGCSKLNITNATIDTPNLTNVTNMSSAFRGAKVFNADINNWDVSDVIDMFAMFEGTTAFNQDISGWDTGKVEDMRLLFQGAEAFNQPIGNWDVSNVTTMEGMFQNATSFNQPIGGWDVSSVTDMGFMFSNAEAFNQDLSSWDTGMVENMSNMFRRAIVFNTNIGGWDVSNVTNMNFMFSVAMSFDQDISGWDTGKVFTMVLMFSDAVVFNQDLSNWDVGKVIRMNGMFTNARAFNKNIGSWDTSSVINMQLMFKDAFAFDQDLSAWDVSNVMIMDNIFNNATLSTENYDALIKGWSAQMLQPNVNFHGGNSTYCTAGTERQNMQTTYGWVITDGGEDTNCNLSIDSYDNTSKKIVVFPNPVEDMLYIQDDNFNTAKLYNLRGAVIATSNSNTFNMSNLSSGIYVLEVIANNSKTLLKVIKK